MVQFSHNSDYVDRYRTSSSRITRICSKEKAVLDALSPPPDDR